MWHRSRLLGAAYQICEMLFSERSSLRDLRLPRHHDGLGFEQFT